MFLAEIHEQVRATARRFADGEIRLAAEGPDREASVPIEIHRRMGTLGLRGVVAPGIERRPQQHKITRFAGDMAVARAADAVQVFGGSGSIRGLGVERLSRDAKITRIHEGTNQIRRMIIACEPLKHGAMS